MRLLLSVLAGTGVLLIALGLPVLRPNDLSHRVEPYLDGLGGPRRGNGWRRGSLRGLFEEAGSLIGVRLSFGDVTTLQARLVLNGSDPSVAHFRLQQLGWGALGAAAFLAPSLIAGLAHGDASVAGGLMASVLGGSAGVVARDRWLARDIARRREEVKQQLPAALDLLTLAVMAGEAVPAAIARLARMLQGCVGREMAEVDAEIRTGRPVSEAIEALTLRLPGSAVARFTDSLCVAMERGTPLAETLRAQADDLREARRRELLELGGKREVLMLVPVVFLILPTVVAFALLPGLVSLDLLVP